MVNRPCKLNHGADQASTFWAYTTNRLRYIRSPRDRPCKLGNGVNTATPSSVDGDRRCSYCIRFLVDHCLRLGLTERSRPLYPPKLSLISHRLTHQKRKLRWSGIEPVTCNPTAVKLCVRVGRQPTITLFKTLFYASLSLPSFRSTRQLSPNRQV
jgi:hypothetical protein